MSLRTSLEAAGLTVRTVTGWGTRGHSWAAGKPVGVMQHHTAPPVPFPVDRLYGDRLKCNINTKPDGTVWLIAQKACDYSSGSGSSIVLDEVLAGTSPTDNARERGLWDDLNGNPYFFNFENDHAGVGGPLPDVQHDAIVRATRVVLDHYGLGPDNVISHAEWTARKTDPYWNGSRRAIEEIRRLLENDMAKIPLEWWAKDAFKWAIDNGLYTEQKDLSKVREEYDFQQLVVFHHRYHKKFGGQTGATDPTARAEADRAHARLDGIRVPK